MFLLVVCSVTIQLVHVYANLFVSRQIDQFRMLSRLSLDFTVIFATTFYSVVGSVVSIFDCFQSANLYKELVDPNEGGGVSA